MTAIEDDLTRTLRGHGSDVTSYDAGDIQGCMCGDLDLIHVDHDDRWAKYDAHLAAVLAPIVAAHVAAGQESMREQRDRLAKWKAGAMPVLDGLQEVGHALGIGLGERITGRGAVDAALDLKVERDAALAKVAALKGADEHQLVVLDFEAFAIEEVLDEHWNRMRTEGIYECPEIPSSYPFKHLSYEVLGFLRDRSIR